MIEFTGERFIPRDEADDEISIEHYQRYNSITELVKGKIVADVACGEGYGANMLADFAEGVFAYDISTEAIEHAVGRYTKENLCFGVAGVDSLPLENASIDVFVSFETLEHVGETLQRAFLSEIRRVLRRDGILIMSTPNKEVYTDHFDYHNPFHVKEFYQEQLVSFLQEYFNDVKVCHQGFEVACVVSDVKAETLKVLNTTASAPTTKYFITICGNEVADVRLGSIVREADGNHLKLLDRIVETQNEIEKLAQWGRNLDDEVRKRDILIAGLREEMEHTVNELSEQQVHCDEILEQNALLKREHDFLEKSNSTLNDKVRQVVDEKNALMEAIDQRNIDLNEQMSRILEMEKELNRKDEVLRSQNEKLISLESRLDATREVDVNALLEHERILNNIYVSQGWKLLQFLYRIRDYMLPPHSKARLLLKVAYGVLTDSSRLKHVNGYNLRKFISYLGVENVNRLDSRVSNFFERHSGATKTAIQMFSPQYGDETLHFPQYDNPRVSIIIPAHNQFSYTLSCLKSILHASDRSTYEVIVADDVSTDGTGRIDKLIKNIKVIRNSTNKGFLRNCNHAATLASGEYILFLNNDTNVQPGWLDSLVCLADGDPTIGLVGSKLVYPDGRLQEAGGIIWSDASGWNYGRLDSPDLPQYNYVKEVDYISGASIMIRKALWKEIGGFDERYAPAYSEDSDLAFEVRRHGYKVVYQPKSVVVHFEGVSHGTDTSSGVKHYQTINQGKFREKWSDVLAKTHFHSGQNIFVARDRTAHKKSLLFIDHYVPHYDKDAGSRTTYQYLRLLCEMGFNVKFLGDNFYRHEPYTSKLEQIGIEVLYGPEFRDKWKQWIMENAEHISYVYLNRPHISTKYIEFVRKNLNARLVYYGHDLHYIRERRQFEIEGTEALLKSAEEWRKVEFNLMERVDAVLTPSTEERDIIQAQLPSKKVSLLPAFYFDKVSEEYGSFSGRSDLLFVGGFSHSPNVDAVKWFVKSVFPLVLQDLPDVKIHIVGSNAPTEIRELQSRCVQVWGSVDDVQLERLYHAVRVVVIPLRYGAGVKGKTIEAMKMGVPIVSTDYGIEGLENISSLITPQNGAAEFAAEIVRLYPDVQRLESESQRYGDYIRAHFSKARAMSAIEDAFGVIR